MCSPCACIRISSSLCFFPVFFVFQTKEHPFVSPATHFKRPLFVHQIFDYASFFDDHPSLTIDLFYGKDGRLKQVQLRSVDERATVQTCLAKLSVLLNDEERWDPPISHLEGKTEAGIFASDHTFTVLSTDTLPSMEATFRDKPCIHSFDRDGDRFEVFLVSEDEEKRFHTAIETISLWFIDGWVFLFLCTVFFVFTLPFCLCVCILEQLRAGSILPTIDGISYTSPRRTALSSVATSPSFCS